MNSPFFPSSLHSFLSSRTENMSIQQEQQQATQRAVHGSIQWSPILERKFQQQRGCCKSLSIIFSIISDTQLAQKPPLQQQVAELKEEIQQQRDLGAAYKARLDRLQEYLRHCLEIARENGFLEQVAGSQNSSKVPEFRPRPRLPAMTPGDPQLEAIRGQAENSGWSIEPHEITLHEKIGKGTTADIYRGTWRGLDVAVKWINPHYFHSNEGAHIWFAQELETLSRQRHPFVLRFLGACLLPPEHGWIVTELLSGNTLAEWLYGCKKRQGERSKSLPTLEERIERAIEIAQAMQYLHEQRPKVIHRDLKPTNILLDNSMHARVADFGHARFLREGEKALTGELGTYVYMAPEVIRCEPYNEKCDVYSFGIILNELITGEHPYIATSFRPWKIALEVGEGRLRPKLPDNDGCNKELIDLISSMWGGDASSRPSFATITSTLRRIQQKSTRSD